MDYDALITALLTSAVEADSLISRTEDEKAACYLQGCRDTFRAMAKAFQSACPLGVGLFQAPVVVKEV